MVVGLFALMMALSSQAWAYKAIVVVRHAEKANAKDPDTVLSLAGEDRALHLARLLRNAGPTHVFVTDTKRSQQTAASVAEQHGLKPLVSPREDTAGLLLKLKALPADAVAVVVGHSDTVPVIVASLTGTAPVTIREDQFGRVFMLTAAGVVELAY
jgi:phosphohistidine phosphatase SixA